MSRPFGTSVEPDWERLLRSIVRSGVPSGTRHIGLFFARAIQNAVLGQLGVNQVLISSPFPNPLRKPIVPPSFLNYACEPQVIDTARMSPSMRSSLETDMPGGGYHLDTANSVFKCIPVENYLATLDEGRNYTV